MNNAATVSQDLPAPSRWEQLYNSPSWTPEIKRFMRQAKACVLRFRRDPDAPSWNSERCFVSVELIKGDGARETRLEFEVAGRINNGHLDRTRQIGDVNTYAVYKESDDNVYAPDSGVWLLHPNFDTCGSVLRSIATGANVIFTVNLDGGSNGYLAEHGLHQDVLCVTIQKGDKQARYLLDSQTSPHNTARFGVNR